LGATLKFWVKLAGLMEPIFDLFSLVAPQPYNTAKKVKLSLIGYVLSNEPKMNIVRCP